MGIRHRIASAPLAIKLAVPFVAVAVGPIVAETVLWLSEGRRQQIEVVRSDVAAAAATFAARVESRLREGQALAAVIATEGEVGAMLSPEGKDRRRAPVRLAAVLRSIMAAAEQIQAILIAGAKGGIAFSTDPRDQGATLESLFGSVSLDPEQSGVLAPVTVAEHGRVIPCAAPIPGGGHVVVLISMRALSNILAPGLSGPGSYGVLLDAPPAPAAPDGAAASVEATCDVRIGGTSLTVLYRTPADVALEPFRRHSRRIVAVAAAAALAAIVVGLAIAAGIGRRIGNLERAVKKAEQGDLATPLEAGPLDEIGRLAQSWERSRAALAGARRDLEQAAEELRAHATRLEVRVEERTREIAEKNSALEQAAREAAGLTHAASELGRETDVERIIERLRTTIRDVLGMDVAVVLLASEDGQELVPAGAPDGTGAVPGRTRIDDPHSTAAQAFRERRTVRIEPNPLGGTMGGLIVMKLCPHMCFAVPIISTDRGVGVLYAGFTDAARSPTDEEIRLAETIAAEAGVALERARLIETLAERERRLRDLFDGAGDLIFAFVPGGRFTRANHATREALGFTPEEILERSFEDLVAGDDPLASVRADDTEVEPSRSCETTLVAKDGRRIPVELRLRVVRRGGKVAEVQAFGRELAQRRELEQRRLEAARLKTAIEIAGAAAHNLNQPLTGILGFLDLLSATPRSGEDQEMLERIREQALRMSEIVAQMQNLTRVETEAYVGRARIVKLK